MKEADDDHYDSVAEKLAAGRMIPFLGAGANLCDRGELVWESGSPFLPSGAELAKYLAARGRYPEPDDHNLVRISQYLEAARGEDEAYLYLREIFQPGYPPTSPASAPRDRGASPRRQRRPASRVDHHRL